MAHHTFKKKEAIEFGWKTFKSNWKILVAIFAVIGFVQWLPSNIRTGSDAEFTAQTAIALLLGIVLQSLTTIGTIVISLRLVDHKKPEVADLFKHYRYILPYLLVAVMFLPFTVVASYIGPFVLLFLPFAIYFAIRLQFYAYFIIDKNMGPIESLKASWVITKGMTMNLFLFGLLLAAVVILGFVALIVGLLVALPVVSIATAYVYRRLSPKS